MAKKIDGKWRFDWEDKELVARIEGIVYGTLMVAVAVIIILTMCV